MYSVLQGTLPVRPAHLPMLAIGALKARPLDLDASLLQHLSGEIHGKPRSAWSWNNRSPGTIPRASGTMRPNARRPALRVPAKLRSSTRTISSRSPHSSLNHSIHGAALAQTARNSLSAMARGPSSSLRKGPGMPSNRPRVAARRISRRSTEPRPVRAGMIPSVPRIEDRPHMIQNHALETSVLIHFIQ